MTRTEIARKLHDMVDAWLNSELTRLFGDESEVCVALRVTYASHSDPGQAVTLVVGTEPGKPEDEE